jgi:hypothetical protein
MDTLSKSGAFDAEDRKVYSSWLQGTLAAYGTVVLCGIAAIVLQVAINAPNAAEFMTAAIALASP